MSTVCMYLYDFINRVVFFFYLATTKTAVFYNKSFKTQSHDWFKEFKIFLNHGVLSPGQTLYTLISYLCYSCQGKCAFLHFIALVMKKE